MLFSLRCLGYPWKAVPRHILHVWINGYVSTDVRLLNEAHRIFSLNVFISSKLGVPLMMAATQLYFLVRSNDYLQSMEDGYGRTVGRRAAVSYGRFSSNRLRTFVS